MMLVVTGLGIVAASTGIACRQFAGQRCHALPDLLGDERHDRGGSARNSDSSTPVPGAPGAAPGGLRRIGVVQHRLGQFEVPVAVLVPGEFVDRLCRLVKAVGLDASVTACLVLRAGVTGSSDRPASAPVAPSTAQSWPSVFINTKREAFHSLLQKLR